MSVMSRGFLASQATAALQVMVLPLVALKESMNAVDMLRTAERVTELSMLTILASWSHSSQVTQVNTKFCSGDKILCHMKFSGKRLLVDFQTGLCLLRFLVAVLLPPTAVVD